MGGNWKVAHLLSELDMLDYDALLLVGGPGGYGYIGDPTLQAIIQKAFRSGKLLTAICMAPQLLAESGLLKGIKATIFPGDASKLSEFGAVYTGAPLEISLPFITADGPASATLFGKAVLAQLK
jgi:putative intracellular protease/amidase